MKKISLVSLFLVFSLNAFAIRTSVANSAFNTAKFVVLATAVTPMGRSILNSVGSVFSQHVASGWVVTAKVLRQTPTPAAVKFIKIVAGVPGGH